MPSGNVRIAPSGYDSDVILVMEPFISFSPEDYNTIKTFTIIPVQAGSTTITLTASGAPEYNSVTLDVMITVAIPSIVCLQTQPVLTSSTSADTEISFVLNVKPSSPVTVTLGIDNNGIISSAPLSFDDTNYFLPHTAKFSLNSQTTFWITATAQHKTGGQEFDNVVLNVYGDAIKQKIVVPTPRTYVAGLTYNFPVSLAVPIAAPVVISGSGSGITATTQLTFTPENWNVPQNFPVTTGAPGSVLLTLVDADNKFSSTLKITIVAFATVSWGARSFTPWTSSFPQAAIILSAEPTSPVTCAITAADPTKANPTPSSVTLSGWVDDDNMRYSNGWPGGRVTVFATSTPGSTTIDFVCQQPGGMSEFHGKLASAYYKGSDMTTTPFFYSPGSLALGVAAGGSSVNNFYVGGPGITVDLSCTGANGVSFGGPGITVDPSCTGANGVSFGVNCNNKLCVVQLTATVALTPSLTECKISGVDAGYTAVDSYAEIRIIPIKITVPRVVCSLGARGCKVAWSYNSPPSGIGQATLQIADTTIASIASANSVNMPLNFISINGDQLGTTTATVTFQGNNELALGVVIDVEIEVVKPDFYAAQKYFTTNEKHPKVNFYTTGQFSNTPIVITCQSSDQSVHGPIQGTFTPPQGNSMYLDFIKPGTVYFLCDVTHNDQASLEYDNKVVEFYAQYIDMSPYGNELVVSSTVRTDGVPGTYSVSVYLAEHVNSETAVSISIVDPSIATPSVTTLTFRPDNYFVPQYVDIQAGSTKGITEIVFATANFGRNTVILFHKEEFVVNFQANQPKCNGDLGSASVSVTVGSGSYTYNWLPAGTGLTTDTSVSGLKKGTYSVQVIDGVHQPFFKSFDIDQAPDAITGNFAVHTDISCKGSNDGALTAAGQGGSGSYKYAWDGLASSAPSLTSLTPGTYKVEISDSVNTCPTATITTKITEPDELTLDPHQTDILCHSEATGTANMSVSGGVAPYKFIWTTLSLADDVSVATELIAGSYPVTVKDDHGCHKDYTFQLSEPNTALQVPFVQTDVLCAGDATGDIQLSANGGTPGSGYSYSWNPEVGNSDYVTKLTAGDYTYNVTDANGCFVTQKVTITEPPVLVATPTHKDVTCHGASTGEVGVTVSGGNSGYSYSWNPSTVTGMSGLGLPAGIYESTVKDKNQCQVVQNITISEPDAFSIKPNYTAIKCYGGSGVLHANPLGGTEPFSYSWYPAGGSDVDSYEVPAGIYVLTASDSCGTTFTNSVIVPQPTPIALVPSQINVACNGDNSGSATVYASGGTPGYTYAWSPYGGTAETASGLSAGTFTVTVTDANGCQAKQTYVISEPDPVDFTYSTVPVKCYGAATGSVTLTVAGGSRRYLYEWNPSVSNGPAASNLVAGTYEVTVADAGFCSAARGIVVAQPSAPLAISPAQNNVACYGGTGNATATVTGGTPGYTYLWTPSGGSGPTATELVAGTYVLTVTDANGCSTTHQYVISQPAPLVASATQKNVTCKGASNGVAVAKASGGALPYSYSWTGSNANNATVSGLAGGQYSVQVTDNNKCTAVLNYTISEPNSTFSVTVAKIDNVCKGSAEGSLKVTPVGGSGNYSYKWATGETTNVRANLTAGSYLLTVGDTGGCTKQFTYTVIEPDVQFCQNNGTCIALDTCVCQGYWNGTDCSSPICPNGCLNNGTCTGANECTCAPGFGGPSCAKSSATLSHFVDIKLSLMMLALLLAYVA